MTCSSSRGCSGRGFEDVATKLTDAFLCGAKLIALTVTDPESILWALDDPPTDQLAELRGVLLDEHEWRVRQGLVERLRSPRCWFRGQGRVRVDKEIRDGWAHAFHQRMGVIEMIGVDPDYQRRGVGTQPTEYAIDYMRDHGMDIAVV